MSIVNQEFNYITVLCRNRMVHFSTQATANLPVLQSVTDQFHVKNLEAKHAIKTCTFG